jgi:exopolysaccharide production protein ExoZ
MAQQGKFGNIQVLRALAAITVVMCHAGQTSAVYTSAPSHLAELSKLLVFGVDLFFVISGFVIYFTTTKSDLSAGEFAKRRLQRILPLYWLLTIAFFVCLLLIPGLKSAALNDWPKFFASLAFLSFTNWGMPVIYPGWTLEYEMLFYALTAAALLVSRRNPWALVAVLLCAASLAKPWLGPVSPALAFVTSSMPLSFLAGILVGQLALRGKVGATEVIAFAVAIVVTLIDDPMQRAIYAGLPSALVVYLAVRSGSSNAHPWLMKLGDASYAIYLLHVFLIAIVGKLSRAASSAFDADMLAVLMTVAPVLAGLALHQWVELPMAEFLSKKKPISGQAQGLDAPVTVST